MQLSFQKREKSLIGEFKNMVSDLQNYHGLLEDFETKYIAILEKDTNNVDYIRMQETLRVQSQDFVKAMKTFQKQHIEVENEKEKNLSKAKSEIRKAGVQTDKAITYLSQINDKMGGIAGLLEEFKREEHLHEGPQSFTMKIEEVYSHVEELLREICEIGAASRKDMDYELELQKYEHKILQMDQEVELAKHTILHYMKCVDSLETMLQNVLEKNNLQESEEFLNMKAEMDRVREQNDNLLRNKRSMEDHHRSQLNQVKEFFQSKIQTENMFTKKLDQVLETITKGRNLDNQEVRLKVARDDHNKGVLQRLATLERFISDLKHLLSKGSHGKVEGGNTRTIGEEIKAIEHEELELLRSQLHMLEEKDLLSKEVKVNISQCINAVRTLVRKER